MVMAAPNTAGLIDTHDVVEHNEVDDLWDVILRQMTPGPFHGRVEFVQINDLIFYREHWNQRVLATGATPAGYFVFGGAVSSENSVDWCGSQVNPEQLAIGAPSSEMEIIFPDESNHIALLVPHQLLQHYFGEELVTDTLPNRHHLACNPHYGCNLVPRLDRMITRYLANPALLADARECKAAEMEIINDLAETFAEFDTKDHHKTPGQRRKKLQQAIAFSQSLQAPITVPEFANATNVNQRTLEHAFRESLDITPRQYMHLHRMNNAHHQLLKSEVGSTRITDVAAHWGFSELGRFAVEYKHLFGESPSVTLNHIFTSPAKRLSNALINGVRLD